MIEEGNLHPAFFDAADIFTEEDANHVMQYFLQLKELQVRMCGKTLGWVGQVYFGMSRGLPDFKRNLYPGRCCGRFT